MKGELNMDDQGSHKINYDTEHDVLYIFFGAPRFAYEDEISPGIYLRKDDGYR